MESFGANTTTLSRSAFWVACVAWTVVAVCVGVWRYQLHLDATQQTAISTARMMIEKDLWYRSWATSHGGVYVPVSPETPPNPYLDGVVEERDLTTPSGNTLTLVNPAYMTRQVYELSGKDSEMSGHLTSLNPIRPENSADEWERRALLTFEEDAAEAVGVVEVEGKQFLRLMRPLVTERGCIKCHVQQGYVVGEVRGGFRVSLPMEPFYASSRELIATDFAVLFILWVGGCFCIWLFFSIDNRRTLERVNRELSEKIAERTNALEEKAREIELFVSMVSHDLQGPLMTISGFSHLLRQNDAVQSDAENQPLLDHIDQATTSMKGLVKRVLGHARLDQTEARFDKVDVAEVFIRVACSLSEQIIEQKAQLSFSEQPPPVFGDEDLCYMILLNLVHNALKYACPDRRARIEVAAELKGATVRLSVRDNGLGIRKEDQEKIFEAYVRLDGSGKGYGLGLASVMKAVAIQKGKLWLESEPDVGSTFHIELPAAPID